MPIPVVYRKSSPIVGTYDYFDAIQGVGYRTFYPTAVVDNSSTEYILTTNTLPGPFSAFRISATGEYNFDVRFGLSATIQGNAILNYYLNLSSGGPSFSGTATLYHVNQSNVETQIGTVTLQNGLLGQAQYSAKIPILTASTFGIGDILRLSIDCTIGGTTFLNIDPASSATTAENSGGATGRTLGTDMRLLIPFKVQN